MSWPGDTMERRVAAGGIVHIGGGVGLGRGRYPGRRHRPRHRRNQRGGFLQRGGRHRQRYLRRRRVLKQRDGRRPAGKDSLDLERIHFRVAEVVIAGAVGVAAGRGSVAAGGDCVSAREHDEGVAGRGGGTTHVCRIGGGAGVGQHEAAVLGGGLDLRMADCTR